MVIGMMILLHGIVKSSVRFWLPEHPFEHAFDSCMYMFQGYWYDGQYTMNDNVIRERVVSRPSL